MRTLCLIVLAALAGCASQPSGESASTAPVAVASAAEPAPATVSSTTDDEFKPPAGYKRRVENGAIYYCTKVTVLGSRFPKDDCRTQAQLEDLEQQKASMRGEMNQRQSICGSATGCASQ